MQLEVLARKTITRLLAALMRMLGFLPLEVRVCLGRIAGAAFSLVPTSDRRIAKKQLICILGPSAARFLPGVYANLGQVLMECINLAPMLSRYHITFDQSALKNTADGTRPVIALTAHLANWELLAAATVAAGFPLSVIGREARVSAFQELLAEIRANYGVQTLWKTSSRSDLKEILQALKANRVIGVLIDQDTRVANTFLPFLGHLAAVPSGMLDIAKKYNARIISAFAVRTSPFSASLLMEEIDASLSQEEILSTFHSRLERLIVSHPEQWVWIHKRWRTLSDGTRLSSQEYEKLLDSWISDAART